MCSQKITIIINGLTGSAEFTDHGVELRGPWASHTGFISVTGIKGNGDAGMLYKLAETYYEENKRLSFLVGPEHREEGWKAISESWCGAVTVKLPHWHQGIVSGRLESYGMQLDCRLNQRWIFPPEGGVSIEVARLLLAPVLRPMTRFADEETLAQEIDEAAWLQGFSHRTPLQAGRAQQALF